MNVTTFAWIALLVFVTAMLLIDLFLHRGHQEITFKEAAFWSTIWVICGVAVGGVIWYFSGEDFALQYYSGYVIEKSLAVDNVFVWGLLFAALSIPQKFQHRVLFFGVVGALLMRAAMIFLGAALIKEFSWTLYIFGVFLIYTGIKMFVKRDEEFSLEGSKVYQLLNRKLRLTPELHEHRFVVVKDGLRYFTPLFLVLVMVEFMDLVFAVDSIPAIFAVTEEPFLVFASNAMAILGLRSMYFLIANLMDKFVYLAQGLSAILVWVGAKMIISHALFKIPTLVSLAVIVAVLVIAIVASMRKVKAEVTA